MSPFLVFLGKTHLLRVFEELSKRMGQILRNNLINATVANSETHSVHHSVTSGALTSGKKIEHPKKQFV